MNYTKLFYWLVVADNAKQFFLAGSIIFSVIVLVSAIWFLVDRDGNDWSPNNRTNQAKKWIWFSTPFMLIFLSLWIFTPNKKDALLIVAGGSTLNFLTTDSSAKQIPHELSNFLVTEIKNMASDAKVELNINDQKQKLLDEAKKMSAEELIKKMKEDSTFKNIVTQ